jgi:hypothetical protein
VIANILEVAHVDARRVAIPPQILTVKQPTARGSFAVEHERVPTVDLTAL